MSFIFTNWSFLKISLLKLCFEKLNFLLKKFAVWSCVLYKLEQIFNFFVGHIHKTLKVSDSCIWHWPFFYGWEGKNWKMASWHLWSWCFFVCLWPQKRLHYLLAICPVYKQCHGLILYCMCSKCWRLQWGFHNWEFFVALHNFSWLLEILALDILSYHTVSKNWSFLNKKGPYLSFSQLWKHVLMEENRFRESEKTSLRKNSYNGWKGNLAGYCSKAR